MALDKGQPDPTMMQTQLQKQQNFQAVLDASVQQQQELQMVRSHEAEGPQPSPLQPRSWL